MRGRPRSSPPSNRNQALGTRSAGSNRSPAICAVSVVRVPAPVGGQAAPRAIPGRSQGMPRRHRSDAGAIASMRHRPRRRPRTPEQQGRQGVPGRPSRSLTHPARRARSSPSTSMPTAARPRSGSAPGPGPDRARRPLPPGAPVPPPLVPWPRRASATGSRQVDDQPTRRVLRVDQVQGPEGARDGLLGGRGGCRPPSTKTLSRMHSTANVGLGARDQVFMGGYYSRQGLMKIWR